MRSPPGKRLQDALVCEMVFHWPQYGHLSAAAGWVTGLTSSRRRAAQPTTNMGPCLFPWLPSAMTPFPGFERFSHPTALGVPTTMLGPPGPTTPSLHAPATPRYVHGRSPTPQHPAGPTPAPQPQRDGRHQGTTGFTQQHLQ